MSRAKRGVLRIPAAENQNAMDLASFLLSVPGEYLAQSFLHALISVMIVERAIHTYGIQDPRVRQQFRFLVMIFPLVSWPLYQVLNPERGSIPFRLQSLLDFQRYFHLQVGGVFPVRWFFLLVLLLSALIFLFQEMIPILRHVRESGSRELDARPPEPGSPVAVVLEEIPGRDRPEVYVVEEEDYVLFSATGRRPAVFVSRGLVEALDADELRVSLLHEMAHIRRNRRPFLVILFVFRVLMFFNPVTLIEFRKIVQEEEKVCDDIAVSAGGNPRALARALRKLFGTTQEGRPRRVAGLRDVKTTLQDYSQALLIESRIQRLEKGVAGKREKAWFRWILVLGVITFVNYYVV